MIYADLKLCYVDLPWCYFAVKNPEDMYGDDWNDRPYEHNAGTPYDYDFKCAIYADYDEPKAYHCNSPWNVEQINRKEIAWLRQGAYSGDKKTPIFAGCTLREFIEIVTAEGGTVYLPFGFQLTGIVAEREKKE